MKRTIKRLPAKTYNDFCWKLEMRNAGIVEVKHAKKRHGMYDAQGRLIAEYTEGRDHGLIYDYHDTDYMVGKVLKFNI